MDDAPVRKAEREDAYAGLASPEAAAEARAGRRTLVFQRRFWPAWTAFVLGVFADNALRQALIIGISFGAVSAPGFLGGDDSIPVIGSLFAVSMLVFSSVAGQVADRNETAFLFRRTKLAEVVIMAAAGAAFIADSGGALIVCLFAMGAQSAFFSPARTAAMPKYFAPRELLRANGLFNAGLYVAVVVGLLVGGALIDRPDGARAVAAVLFIAAGLGWSASLRAPSARAGAPDLEIDWSIVRQTIRLARFAGAAPGVLRPILGVAFFFFLSTMVTVLVPLYVRDGLGAGAGVANILMGGFAIGAGLGALGVSALAKGGAGLRLSTIGMAGSCAATVLAAALTAPAARALQSGTGDADAFFGAPVGVALFALFTTSAAMLGFFVVPLQAAIQRRAPEDRRARIIAANNMLVALAAIGGSLSVLTVTGAGVTPQAALFAAAFLQALVGAEMIRRARRVAPGLHDEGLEPKKTAPPRGDAV